jgi:hypothetical protein
MSFVRRYLRLQGFRVPGDFESRIPAVADPTERAIIL